MTILQYEVEDFEDLEIGDALTIFTSSPFGLDYMHIFEGELLSVNDKQLVMVCLNKTKTELVETKIPTHRISQINKRINLDKGETK